VNITNAAGAQSETTIAVDPTDSQHLFAASNDLGSQTMFIYESTDAGKHWAKDPGFSVGGEFCYDPWLSFNAVGDAFFAYECFTGTIQRVAYRMAGTANWVKTNLNIAGAGADRDMIVTDRGASQFSGSVYIGYDDFAQGNSAYVVYSRDGFGGWAKSAKINGASATIGVNASAAPDGTVYAVWEDYNGRKVMVDKSTDGGATWGTDHVVTNYRLFTGSFFLCIPPQPDRCVVPMPFSTVVPGGTHAGRLIVTYPDKSATTSDWDVFVRYSDDGGVSWSPEVEVDVESVNAYQFFPAITASPTGVVAVTWYDTQNDQPSNHKTDRYIAYSLDGGDTWTAPQKLTTAMSDESGAGDPNDYGDYEGVDAATNGSFFAVWCDSRATAKAEDMFMARAKP
jgi:hypothetical protein